jgi:signal recognition particle subunit SEC65
MKNKGEILAALLNKYDDCYFFLHNTKEKAIAEIIMQVGFMFENQLPHSTDRVNPGEPIEVTYFLFQRKDYGAYTMIIAISKRVYERYTHLSNLYDLGIEDIMTISRPFYSDNDELIYTISPRHILGYFNNKTSEFIRNPLWEEMHDSSLTRSFKKRPAGTSENP